MPVPAPGRRAPRRFLGARSSSSRDDAAQKFGFLTFISPPQIFPLLERCLTPKRCLTPIVGLPSIDRAMESWNCKHATASKRPWHTTQKCLWPAVPSSRYNSRNRLQPLSHCKGPQSQNCSSSDCRLPRGGGRPSASYLCPGKAWGQTHLGVLVAVSWPAIGSLSTCVPEPNRHSIRVTCPT